MPKRILIADDNALMRRLIRGVLESQPGLEVCGEAVDGVEAIEKATELRPDLVVLDLSMPRMHGLEAGRRLKILIPTVRLILFTMHRDVVRGLEASSAGIDVVTSKSEGMGALVTEIHGMFRAQSAAS